MSSLLPGIRRPRYQETQVSGDPGIAGCSRQSGIDLRGGGGGGRVWTSIHTYSLIITT